MIWKPGPTEQSVTTGSKRDHRCRPNADPGRSPSPCRSRAASPPPATMRTHTQSPQLPSWKGGERRWVSEGEYVPKGSVLNRERQSNQKSLRDQNGCGETSSLGRRVGSRLRGRLNQILRTSRGYTVFYTRASYMNLPP